MDVVIRGAMYLQAKDGDVDVDDVCHDDDDGDDDDDDDDDVDHDDDDDDEQYGRCHPRCHVPASQGW